MQQVGWKLAALALVLVSACGGDDSSGSDAAVPHNDAGIGCKLDPRGETYSANMEKMGKDGKFRFVLVASDPAPPVKGNNAWTVKLLDATSGAPVTGATIDAVPYMPDHGHGTSAVPVTTPSGDGYTINPLYLFMPGIWQITLKAKMGDVSDQAVYDFCIQG